MDPASLGSVLLIGGGGFMGSAIIQALLRDQSHTSIAVAGLNHTSSFGGVTYYSVNIAEEWSVRHLLAITQPRLIFHLASPLPGAPTAAFEQCNIKGTEILLRCAKECETVEALLYTSSNQALANEEPGTINEETATLWTASSKIDAYSRTKAVADAMVQKANSQELKTVVLRCPNVYGGLDAYMSLIMRFLWNGLHKIQLGETSALFEFVAAENAAHAHLLAAKATLSPSKQARVAGEAFFITDNQPDTWYGFARKAWTEAGDSTSVSEVLVIPFWVLFTVAYVYEWMIWMFTLGRKEPGYFTVGNVRKLKKDQNRLDIAKARERLGYEPIVGREQGLRRAVENAVEFHKRKKRNKSKDS